MGLHATPLVPLQEAVKADQKKHKKNKNQGPDLGDLDEVLAKIVHDGGIHLVTEH
jgi:hypothetical protein